MEFSVYGSIRAGLVQKDTDDADTGNIRAAGVVNIDSPDVTGNQGGVANTPVVTKDGAEGEGSETQELGNVSDPAFSRFGVKGSEDLGNGLSAGFQFERGLGAGSVDFDEEESTDGTNLRHENVWIKGGWGKFTLGQQSNPYRNAANWDQSWYIGGNNRYNDGGTRNNGIRYDSAALGAVRFSLMATADGSEGAETSAGGDVVVNDGNDADFATNFITVTKPATEDEDGIDRLIATIHYDIGDIATINLGYQTNEQESNEPGVSYDNAVISANGSAGPLTWYVAYEDNSDNYEEPGIVSAGNCLTEGDAATPTCNDGRNYVAKRYVAQDAETVGVFLAFDPTEKDRLYLEYEDSSVDGAGEFLESLDKESILLGYSHKFGPHTAFVAEYLTVDTESDFVADTDTLLATLKVDF